MNRSTLLASVALVIVALPAPAFAEDDPAAAETTDDNQIVVTGHALKDMGLMAGSIELEGDKLTAQMATQIGDLVASMPGVSATSFAPGASRPVLRGLSGDRVQVLIDGLGAIDASSVSADHGVALDTLAIDHVDVLHGPALLAFGGQAIGGAVNAADKRIPRAMPADGIDVTALGSFESVSDGWNAGASIDVPLAERLAFHADASWHDSADLRVGGNAVSAPLRAEALAIAADLRAAGDGAAADAVTSAANRRGRVDNTFTHGTSFAAGLAFLDDGGSLGVSVTRMDNRYGIPGRPGTGEEGVSIDLGQTRFDFRGHVMLGGLFDSLQLRAAYGDYGHAELEADGAVGTRFARKGIESRMELVQAKRGGWKGRSGLQYASGSLDVTGEEAILPANRDERIGLFTLQSFETDRIALDAAARIERVSIRSGPARFSRSYSLRSAAAGAAWKPLDGLKLGLNWSHGERAPSAEELLTDGLHVATQAFEIGNPGFRREQANGLEAYIHYDAPGTSLALTAYRTRFTGFITPVPTGALEEGFPVYAYQQVPARFTGFEAQASQRLIDRDGLVLVADGAADYVRASLKNLGPAPQIPPMRLQGGLEATHGALSLRGEIEWNARQKRVGPFENPTGAFTLVNASATWRPLGEDGPLTLILSGDNLLDVIGRRAASATRDFVPIAGRNVKLSAKLSF